MHAPISFVEACGYRLECVEIAARKPGPALLFLHEGLGSVSTWRDFPARVAERTGHRTITYSRAGFGRSSPRGRPYTKAFMHEEALEVLPALRARLAIDKAILVGHSTGASMALIHASRAEAVEDVAGVVAIAPFAFVEASNVEAIRAARDRYGDIRTRLGRHHDDVDGVFHGWTDTWLDPAFREWTIDRELDNVRCPVLAILGERDEYSTGAQLERIVARAPRVQVMRLPESGHAPHRDQPDVIIGAIDQFASTLEA